MPTASQPSRRKRQFVPQIDVTGAASLLLISNNVGRDGEMGGLGSGRSSTRSLVEHSLTIDLPLLMRRGRLKDGQRGRFVIRNLSNGEYIIAFHDLRDPDEAWLELNYRQFIRADVQPEVAQYIPLTFTVPHFGGRRWWMICPYCGQRVAKLYLPPGGDTFACREEWQLVYESQRRDQFWRALARLDRLERQLARQERKRAKAGHAPAIRRDTEERLSDELQHASAHCAAAMESSLRNI